MASSSRLPNDIEDICANLCLEEEEDDIITLGQSIQKVDEGVDTRWCLVGTFVQDHQMDFDTIQHQLASLWKPGMGMFCKELGQNRYLFQFFHDVDINRVIEGSPWTCLRKLLIFNRLTKNDDPRTIPLNKLDIWIQIFDMQPGYMSARVVQDVGNRIGVFIESDPNNFKGFWRNYLRIRVTINIEKPLRRKMKISPEGEDSFWVHFKYERAPTFCFICGIIGHTENFCAKLFQTPLDQIVKPYGIWMKATPIQQNKYIGSKWLRNVGWEPGLAPGGSTFNRNASATNMVTDSDAELDETSNDPRLNSNPINQGGNQDMITGMRIGNHNTDFSPSQPPAASFNVNGMKKQGLIITDIKRRRTEDMVDAEVEVISVDDSVGTSVSILNDPWLPAEMDGFIHSSHPALLQQAVSSLLQQDVKDWDIDILNDLFNDRDKDLILQLQLSPTTFEDSWYWLNDRAETWTPRAALPDGSRFLDHEASHSTAFAVLQATLAPPGTVNRAEFCKNPIAQVKTEEHNDRSTRSIAIAVLINALSRNGTLASKPQADVALLALKQSY
ncbi:hypothetical protein F8388_011702 [Cannabis sativa]|uniref:Zinc knuckle CX2CX4HX4C domain-containing protein n=1 Tax=Cannabis sativa TaxID=3483 RepID=A0A7J6GX67_CANSA|nr:hypothetical protein F8388_011702 [Cannabis sativa]